MSLRNTTTTTPSAHPGGGGSGGGGENSGNRGAGVRRTDAQLWAILRAAREREAREQQEAAACAARELAANPGAAPNELSPVAWQATHGARWRVRVDTAYHGVRSGDIYVAGMRDKHAGKVIDAAEKCVFESAQRVGADEDVPWSYAWAQMAEYRAVPANDYIDCYDHPSCASGTVWGDLYWQGTFDWMWSVDSEAAFARDMQSIFDACFAKGLRGGVVRPRQTAADVMELICRTIASGGECGDEYGDEYGDEDGDGYAYW